MPDFNLTAKFRSEGRAGEAITQFNESALFVTQQPNAKPPIDPDAKWEDGEGYFFVLDLSRLLKKSADIIDFLGMLEIEARKSRQHLTQIKIERASEGGDIVKAGMMGGGTV